MVKISLKLTERLLKEKGALRVSKEAKKLLAKTLKEEAEKIAFIAIKNAQHFGRKLITKEDIEFAKKQLNQSF